MVALDENRPDVRTLPALIEFHESAGRFEHAQLLREWLEEAKQSPVKRKASIVEPEILLPGDEDYENAEPDETIVTTSLPWKPSIRNRLYDREVTDVAQLTRWRLRFLRAILPADDVWAVEQLCTAVGFPVGSAVELLATLPPRSPFGLDLRDGRTPADVTDVLRQMAYGELTFRDASVVLGSRGLSKVRPHQRSCSVVQRHAKSYANFRRMAMLEQHHGEGWLIDAGLHEFPGAKPGWGLWVKIATSEKQVRQILDRARPKESVTPKPVYGGIASRGCPMILIAKP